MHLNHFLSRCNEKFIEAKNISAATPRKYPRNTSRCLHTTSVAEHVYHACDFTATHRTLLQLDATVGACYKMPAFEKHTIRRFVVANFAQVCLNSTLFCILSRRPQFPRQGYQLGFLHTLLRNIQGTLTETWSAFQVLQGLFTVDLSKWLMDIAKRDILQ